MVASAGGILPLLAAIALAVGVLLYVCLDGADLGVGVLFAFNRGHEDRQVMAYSILPIWDGNETWLVLVAGGTLALFPKAFSVLLTAFYLPLILMLMALAIRGTCLEFRGEATPAQRRRWDTGFCIGSILAAFAQGVVAGAFLHGIAVGDDAYGDGWRNWVNPFAFGTGAAVVFAYATLGAAWLVYRTKGDLQWRVRRQALIFAGLTAVAMIALGCRLPLMLPHYNQRWTTMPGPLAIGLLGCAMLIAAAVFIWGIHKRMERVPLGAVLAMFCLVFLCAWFTVFPLIVPPSITLGMAASSRMSQLFVLCNYAVAVPVILAYNTFSFYVFRGKVESPAKQTSAKAG
jgi:cytochrome d ubiquinol oxidase subunit II